MYDPEDDRRIRRIKDAIRPPDSGAHLPMSDFDTRNTWNASRLSPAEVAALYIGAALSLIILTMPFTADQPPDTPAWWILSARLDVMMLVGASGLILYLLAGHFRRRQNASGKLIQATFVSAPEAICITSLDDLAIIRANDRFCRIFGQTETAPPATLASLWNVSNDLARFRQLLNDFGEVNEFSTIFKTEAGALLNVVLSTRAVEFNSRTSLITSVRDISRLVRAEKRAEELAHHDPETGLPNHNLLLDRLNQIIALDTRERRGTAIICISLSCYRAFLDEAGDSVAAEQLRKLAGQLGDTLRQTDTIARINRDEFAVALGGKVAESDIFRVLNKLRALLGRPVHLPGGSMSLRPVFGIACFPNDGLTAEQLLRNAYIALDCVRDTQGTDVHFFSPAISDRIRERSKIENSLECALEKREFFLCYQPKFAHNGREMVGMEALVRWNQPDNGLITPDRFIPLAEENGFIVTLGEWILNEACRQNKAWQEAGYPRMKVSVNISLRQLHELDFVESVAGALKRSGLESRYLELELTESVIMSDPDDTIMKLLRLKELGISLAVDDFGTGYSSLSYLKHLPIDTLKIDRSFVRDIHRDLDDEAIVSAIISLAHSLKLRVVAEGVETCGQMEFLKKIKCNEFQGFLLSTPLDSEKFEELLRGMVPRDSDVDDDPWLAAEDAHEEESTAKRDSSSPVESEEENVTHDYIGDLIIPVVPLKPTVTIPYVLNRFQSDQKLLILPVVENGLVVGMVNRLVFLEEHVIGRHGFGYHINHAKKIRELMEPPEISIDFHTRIDEAAFKIQSLKSVIRIDYVCITHNGGYIGLLDVNRFVSAMSERNLALAKGANPLTGLPGNESIQRLISEKLEAKLCFDIAYIDIDNFKPYNDCYGFQKGDMVIKALAEIVRGVVSGSCAEGECCFCGHIGGDDFILICEAGASPAIAAHIIRDFDLHLARFHGEIDFANTCYHSVNRKGERETFPLLSISIGIVNTRLTPVESYAELSELSAGVKKEAKRLSGSSVVVNRNGSPGQEGEFARIGEMAV